MNVTSTCASTTAVSCSVATSSSESLPNNGEKPNQPKKLLFLKYDYGGRKTKVCIHLYWKDGRSRKTGRFCKHKPSSLYNQAVEVIFQD